MIYNKKMEIYLNQINMYYKTNILINSMKLTILKGKNCIDESYFYFKDNCCNLNENSDVTFTGEMLTQLEWDCNELYINDSDNAICLLQTALTIVKEIQLILKIQYSLQSFDIVMSFDDGKDFDVLPSATIRFYANRNSDYISHDKLNLENFDQPILIESVN